MTRLINDHIANKAKDKLTIVAADEPCAAGLNHLYVISGFNPDTNPACAVEDGKDSTAEQTTILFQNGQVREVGENGVTNEALLAIVVDRLRCIQAGLGASPTYGIALTKLEDALDCLKHKTILMGRSQLLGMPLSS
ncbi:hypothetical protein [Achromobacter sp. NFACC18-2]|uniref:hypothetical protein n=1 Tax=Achromobacter sp. NFACC18-2 TaxID=1564112 RepID=UPI0008D663B8|nr:hypothetical protein [Achromobacter sp. NFACC18-2]SEK05126.1 hypothetical protein SAMN03159494_04648 [Achromobacter sp. NFACC18-2]